MPDQLRYLTVMAACLVVTVPLWFFPGVRVHRSLRRLAGALLPVVLVFTAWDLVGIARGHWSYAARYVTGLDLGPMPVEELVFFLVVPLCTVLTYEAVGAVLRQLPRRRRRAGASGRV